MIESTGDVDVDGGEERVEHFEEAILSFFLSFWVSKPEVCSRVTVKKCGCYFLFLSSSKEGMVHTSDKERRKNNWSRDDCLLQVADEHRR